MRPIAVPRGRDTAPRRMPHLSITGCITGASILLAAQTLETSPLDRPIILSAIRQEEYTAEMASGIGRPQRLFYGTIHKRHVLADGLRRRPRQDAADPSVWHRAVAAYNAVIVDVPTRPAISRPILIPLPAPSIVVAVEMVAVAGTVRASRIPYARL